MAACEEARYVNLGMAPEPSGGAGTTSGGSAGTGGALPGGTAGESGESGGVGAAGAGGTTGPLRPMRFGVRGPIRALIPEVIPDDLKQDNPTLNAAKTELYFTSNRAGGVGEADVWVSTRTSASGDWGEPELVERVNTDQDESSPAVSPDGMKLWVGIDSDEGLGELDIWEWTRGSASATDWRDPRNVGALNSEFSDIPRPPGHAGIMPMASRRSDNGRYWTYFARPTDMGDDFLTPELLPVLNVTAGDTVDGFLTDDGLRFFYNREPREGEGELFVAYRASVDDDFTNDVERLLDIVTDGDERDPWLGGSDFYYSSDAEGFLTIWHAEVVSPDD